MGNAALIAMCERLLEEYIQDRMVHGLLTRTQVEQHVPLVAKARETIEAAKEESNG